MVAHGARVGEPQQAQALCQVRGVLIFVLLLVLLLGGLWRASAVLFWVVCWGFCGRVGAAFGAWGGLLLDLGG